MAIISDARPAHQRRRERGAARAVIALVGADIGGTGGVLGTFDAEDDVGAARSQAQHVDAGRDHRHVAPVREHGLLVVEAGRADGQHLVRRRDTIFADVDVFIAGRHHDHRALRIGIVDRRLLDRADFWLAADADINDARAVVGGVSDRLGDVGRRGCDRNC